MAGSRSAGPQVSAASESGEAAAIIETTETDGGPFVIGLTGPIGCGKSTVARMLADLGAVVIDADVLARQATSRDGPSVAAIRARFGAAVFSPDGALDRQALAKVVFGDAAALRDLELAVHPEVRRLVEAEWQAARIGGALMLVIEAIKLIEGGLAERCDEVWLVDCGPAEQRERLRGRASAADDIERRLVVQAGLTDRLAARASRRVVTSGHLEETRERVEEALADSLAPALLSALTTVPGPRRPH